MWTRWYTWLRLGGGDGYGKYYVGAIERVSVRRRRRADQLFSAAAARDIADGGAARRAVPRFSAAAARRFVAAAARRDRRVALPAGMHCPTQDDAFVSSVISR